MKTKVRCGAALLIAVLMMLVLTLISGHLLTLASVNYRTDQLRRYTSNTAFHSEAGVMQMVENMNKALLNYSPTYLQPMIPMMTVLSLEDQEILACAYGYRWLTEQYFKWGILELDLSVGGQRRLTYEVKTEVPLENMKTFINVGLYVKGMTGRAGDSGWLGTLPSAQVEDLTDYKEVGRLLRQIEAAVGSGDRLTIALAMRQLEGELDKPHFVIESIAQTKEGVAFYDTQQRIGRVRIETVDQLAGLTCIGDYTWRREPPQALAQEVLCYGELGDEGRLHVQGTLRHYQDVGGITEDVIPDEPEYWREMATKSQGAIIYVEEQGTIDLAQLGGDDEGQLLVLGGTEGKVIYSSEPSERWKGILIAYNPVEVEGPVTIEGALLCNEGLRVVGEAVKVVANREMFFQIGDYGLRRALLEQGIWKGVGSADQVQDERMALEAKGRILGVVLETMVDGRMVDRKGADAWE